VIERGRDGKGGWEREDNDYAALYKQWSAKCALNKHLPNVVHFSVGVQMQTKMLQHTRTTNSCCHCIAP